MSWFTFLGRSQKTGEAGHIASLTVVKTALKTRQNVTVFLPNAPEERWRSFFVGVNQGPESGFYIDPMVPDVSERSFEPGRTLAVIRCSVAGAPHEIQAVFAGKEDFGGFPSLKFHPPVSVKNLQRREFFRVEPKRSEPVGLDIQNGLNETTSALDISLGGVRFRASSKVSQGEAFELTMKIPGAPSHILNAMAHVRDCSQTNMARNAKTVKPYCVRVEFDKIDDRDAHSLNKYLFNRQRELRLISL
jgi:c-di-GMP-binding flagellar brake protein YcgR